MSAPRPVVALDGLSRLDWLRARQHGVGGSDVAAIMGLSPYGDAFTVYADKITPVEEQDNGGSPLMRLGQLLEDGIANAYAETYGAHITKPEYLYAHAEHDWMLANIDRWTDNPWPGVLEVKLGSRRELWDDGLPDRYELQARHYLAVVDREYCDVAALLGGRDLALFTVERDRTIEEQLIAIELDFWQHVVDRRPPTPDHLATDALRRMYRQPRIGSVVELPVTAADDIVEYVAAKNDAKLAAQRADAAGNRLRALLGDDEIGTIDGVEAVTWKLQDANRVDLDALDRDHPGLLDLYRRPAPVRVLRTKRGFRP